MNDQVIVKPSGKLGLMNFVIFMVVVVIGRFATLDYPSAIYFWGVVFACGLVYFFMHHLTRITSIYMLDASNLTSQIGLFSKHTTKIPLNRITNYEVKQSFFERMLGLGDLMIDTAGGSGTELAMIEMEISDINILVKALDRLLAQNRLETGKNEAKDA